MQKTMARQMLVVVLGPMLVLPLFAVMRDTEGLALLLVLAVMLLVDCAPVRRHAGRLAEIRFQPGLRGQNVVYGVQVDGRVLRTHEDAVAHYRAWRWRGLQRLGLILLLITLPHVWMGWRARTFMRRQPTGAAA